MIGLPRIPRQQVFQSYRLHVRPPKKRTIDRPSRRIVNPPSTNLPHNHPTNRAKSALSLHPPICLTQKSNRQRLHIWTPMSHIQRKDRREINRPTNCQATPSARANQTFMNLTLWMIVRINHRNRSRQRNSARKPHKTTGNVPNRTVLKRRTRPMKMSATDSYAQKG